VATTKLSDLISRLVRRSGPPDQTAPDSDLLERFLADRDDRAFAELVRRHGPTVFGVCRRVTRDFHLAEDAFQAVFVVLAAKAGSVRPGAALPAWLYGVAYRTALRARTMSDRRRRREAPVGTPPESPGAAADPVPAADWAAVLDEEIARLPDRLRVAVVLCELGGRSRREAATRLGIPEGTLSSRLAAARKRLAARLRERSVTLSAAAVTAAWGRVGSAHVPAALTAKAVAAATAPGQVSAAVAALSNGELRLMFAQKLKAVPVALGLVAVVLAGGLLPAADPPQPAARPGPQPAAVRPQPPGPGQILLYRMGHLTLIDPDGTNGRKVGEDAPRFLLPSARLAPDGTRLAALVQTPQAQLVPAPPAGPEGQRVELKLYVRGLGPNEPWTDLGVKCQSFAWSPDGAEIACSDFPGPDFTSGPNKQSPGATHLVVNAASKQKTALKLSGDHVITDWSRDGKFFLTTSVAGPAAENCARLHLMNRDGTEHKALTDGARPAIFGRLSPDGKRVLYCTLTAPEEGRPAKLGRVLAVLDLATGGVARVEESGDIWSYCWSPDGKRIAYTWREVHEGKFEDLLTRETESYLVICDPDGLNRKTITSAKGRGQTGVSIDLGDWR
jgi:RNA polymerase sigma factor (sigma-70 family)